MPPVPNSATSVFETEKPVGVMVKVLPVAGPVLVQVLPEQVVWVSTLDPDCVLVDVVPLTFVF
jgi:hypothetical protein